MSVCKKCLVSIPTNREYCESCYNKIEEKRKIDIEVEKLMAAEKAKKEEAKARREAEKEYIDRLIIETRLEGLLEDDDRVDRIEKRIQGMKEGKSYLILDRKITLSGAGEDCKISVYNHTNSKTTVYTMANGPEQLIELEAPCTYSLRYKRPLFKESEPLTIDLKQGETYHIEVKNTWLGGVGSIIGMLARLEGGSSKIVGREKIVNGEWNIYGEELIESLGPYKNMRKDK